MIILRPKNVIFERFWPLSKLYFSACSTLPMLQSDILKTPISRLKNLSLRNGLRMELKNRWQTFFWHRTLLKITWHERLVGEMSRIRCVIDRSKEAKIMLLQQIFKKLDKACTSRRV